MSYSIQDYRKMVEEPWGRMFYDLVHGQLQIPENPKAKILDFGAGFCLTADHYAKDHDVLALEPNEEMVNLRIQNNDYELVNQGIVYLTYLKENTFDVVICHNVLEYADNREDILRQLVRVLKPGGIMSIVKHNKPGRVMALAVMNDNPMAALHMLGETDFEKSIFGGRSVYDDADLTELLSDKMELVDTYGIRAFFGLSSNNEIKYTKEWYQDMLELERKVGKVEEFRKIAFFNHLIFRKK